MTTPPQPPKLTAYRAPAPPVLSWNHNPTPLPRYAWRVTSYAVADSWRVDCYVCLRRFTRESKARADRVADAHASMHHLLPTVTERGLTIWGHRQPVAARPTIRKALATGALPSHRVGRRILISLDDVDAYIRGGGDDGEDA